MSHLFNELNTSRTTTVENPLTKSCNERYQNDPTRHRFLIGLVSSYSDKNSVWSSADRKCKVGFEFPSRTLGAGVLGSFKSGLDGSVLVKNWNMVSVEGSYATFAVLEC